jgi:predicted nucleic acid-binding protein
MRRVDTGEAEALTLAEELPASVVLLDEHRGRSLARSLGINVIGTVGILVEAQRRALITDAGALLRRLRSENGFYVTDAVIRSALASIDNAKGG